MSETHKGPALRDAIIALWNDGKSGAQIARLLGISKGTVTGQVNRNRHLVTIVKDPAITHCARAKSNGSKAVRRTWIAPMGTEPADPAESQPDVPDSVEPDLPAPLPRRSVPFRLCHWPHGDPKKPGFHFCEKPVYPSRPYCPEHCEKAYQGGPAR